MTISKKHLEEAHDLVLGVLRGTITWDNSPYVFEDDVLYFTVADLEKHDSDWLYAQITTPEYDIKNRRQIASSLSPEFLRKIVHVPGLVYSVEEKEKDPELLKSLPFEIISPLGGGMYTDVYKARGQTGVVAVKLARSISREKAGETCCMHFALGQEFHTGSSDSWAPDPNKILLKEVMILSRIRHPAMVKLADADIINGLVYIVTEYIEGSTWRELLDSDNPPTIGMVCQLVEALLKMSKAGELSYHGDIKPDNLFLDRAGIVRIIDPSSGMTEIMHGSPRRILLTPWYNPGSLPSDIPALGMLSMEVSTGKQPLFIAKEKSPKRTLSDKLKESLHIMMVTGSDDFFRLIPHMPLPTELNLDLPEGLEAVALRCLGLERRGEVLDCCDSYNNLKGLLKDLQHYA